MSDLVIRSGSVVEVDTDSLRAVAVEVEGIAGELGALARDAARAVGVLDGLGAEAMLARAEAGLLAAALARDEADTADLAEAVRRTIDLYESAELLVERRMAAASGDTAAVARLDRALVHFSPSTIAAASDALSDGADRGELLRQAVLGALSLGAPLLAATLPLFAAPLGGAIDRFGRGRVANDERLTGPAPPVAVTRLSYAPAVAPVSLADAGARLPDAGEARVRVERYAMPSGAAQFAVYVTGTRGIGGDGESFDMRSNIALYNGQRSASYQATLAALADAGAQPGDVVHAVGHSQGAMVVERLALEGPYDVRSVTSFGSPVHADLGEGTLGVSLRHTDDPVAALQAGGHAAAVGAPGSLVIERVADPAPGLHDLAIPAHQMSAYLETAAMADASSDPRLAALTAVYADLQRAESVSAVEYAAERLSPRASAAG